MTFRIALLTVMTVLSSSAFAATVSSSNGTTAAAATATMKELLTQGYEIKAAVPNGDKFVIFMQKEQSAYACEFVSVTNTKCGAIN